MRPYLESPPVFFQETADRPATEAGDSMLPRFSVKVKGVVHIMVDMLWKYHYWLGYGYGKADGTELSTLPLCLRRCGHRRHPGASRHH